MARKKIVGTAERPRLVVSRSLKHIHAQLVDDYARKVIIGLTDYSKDVAAEAKKAKSKTEAAAIVGKKLAEKAQEKKIKKVVFDRNGYIYHGRIKALADGAREGGLEF
ncbi:MAG: 50S ribosomal protein L18 [Calditrichaeota bacterium]|nr:MAG: 50S ribosomal protein L18 [Calditrichota bacterium]